MDPDKKVKIGRNAPVFVIAEIGCNFEDDFKKAKEMVKAAADAGADAVKFQTFNADKLVTKKAPKFWDIEGCPGETQHEEFNAMYQPNLEQFKELKSIADKNGIFIFSTPYDDESIEMMEKLGVELYKISSMDLTHIPLLKDIAKKGKPVILSTGASTIEEIKKAVKTIESAGNKQLSLLHCISSYPTGTSDVNLNMMKDLMKVFPDHTIGYSDHTKMPDSREVIAAAVAMGAKIIEKHFTFDRSRPGYDHEISADYNDLKEIVHSIRTVEKALGSSKKEPTRNEEKMRMHGRRSLVALCNIKSGTVIKKEMVSVKRPGTGIEPKFLEKITGKKAKKDIKEDEVIKWEMIE